MKKLWKHPLISHLWLLDMRAISLLALVNSNHKYFGRGYSDFFLDDGSLRVYDLSSFKVLKAVRGLGAEVSSIVCMKKPGSDLRDAWVAHGKNVSSTLVLAESIFDESCPLYRFQVFRWIPRK